MEPSGLIERITSLDTSLFEIHAELGPDDRRSLLALQAVFRRRFGTFVYLEIGSHIGGSLQTFVRDPACRSAISIDPRPLAQPDERGETFRYADNSTERMLERLRAFPDADISKLTTIELSTEDIDVSELPEKAQLAFIDGEHTDRAALRDAEFALAALAENGCVVFHDAPIVHRAIATFVEQLDERGVPFAAAAVPNRMFVVEVGDAGLLREEPLAAVVGQSFRAYFKALAEFDRYRVDYIRPSRRMLRQADTFGGLIRAGYRSFRSR